jgi:hypothetical protein
LRRGDLSSLMKLALSTFVEQEEKRRFAVGRGARKGAVDVPSHAFGPGAPPLAPMRPVGTPSAPPGEAAERPRAAAKRPNRVAAPRRSAPLSDGVAARPSVAAARPSVAAARPSTAPPSAVPPSETAVWLDTPERSVPPGARFHRTTRRSRYVPAAVRCEVYLRDRGQCSFVSVDGRRCEARSFLELDHIEPWAALGATVTGNLRVRCRAHNALHARNCFGARHLEAKVAARRGD